MTNKNDEPKLIPVMGSAGYQIPANSKGGDFTGKCWKCGSRNLWDDNLSYGCNDCGMIRIIT